MAKALFILIYPLVFFLVQNLSMVVPYYPVFFDGLSMWRSMMFIAPIVLIMMISLETKAFIDKLEIAGLPNSIIVAVVTYNSSIHLRTRTVDPLSYRSISYSDWYFMLNAAVCGLLFLSVWVATARSFSNWRRQWFIIPIFLVLNVSFAVLAIIVGKVVWW